MARVFTNLILIFFLTIGASCDKEDGNCIENPQPNCACGYYLDPVCGCNGKTYANGCVAQCAGILEFSMGECN